MKLPTFLAATLALAVLTTATTSPANDDTLPERQVSCSSCRARLGACKKTCDFSPNVTDCRNKCLLEMCKTSECGPGTDCGHWFGCPGSRGPPSKRGDGPEKPRPLINGQLRCGACHNVLYDCWKRLGANYPDRGRRKRKCAMEVCAAPGCGAGSECGSWFECSDPPYLAGERADPIVNDGALAGDHADLTVNDGDLAGERTDLTVNDGDVAGALHCSHCRNMLHTCWYQCNGFKPEGAACRDLCLLEMCNLRGCGTESTHDCGARFGCPPRPPPPPQPDDNIAKGVGENVSKGVAEDTPKSVAENTANHVALDRKEIFCGECTDFFSLCKQGCDGFNPARSDCRDMCKAKMCGRPGCHASTICGQWYGCLRQSAPPKKRGDGTAHDDIDAVAAAYKVPVGIEDGINATELQANNVTRPCLLCDRQHHACVEQCVKVAGLRDWCVRICGRRVCWQMPQCQDETCGFKCSSYKTLPPA